MAIRPIVLYASDPAFLRQRSAPVEPGSGAAAALLTDLKDTLLHHVDGIGLAAPQIAAHLRVIVVRLGFGQGGGPGPPIGIINPTIVEAGRELPDHDGCLSLPGFHGETVRPHAMRLRGLDERERAFEWTLEGFDAVVVHHEIDHLNGVLFIDRLVSLDALYAEEAAHGG